MLDIHHPENPVLLFSKSFDRRDGTPRSVSFCAPQIGIGELAVALSAPVSDTLEGHVQFFHPHQRGSAATDLTRDGYMTGKSISKLSLRDSDTLSSEVTIKMVLPPL